MRLFEPHECSKDGYPRHWHDFGPDHELARHDAQTGKRTKYGIKHLVRDLADHRCARCGHRYTGGGRWTECDARCTHRAPYRIHYVSGEVAEITTDGCAEAGFAAASDPSIVTKVEASWRVLTVHHLDGDKRNCRWWNLAPLCQRCHLQIQGKVRMERVWPWEHSDWFKPYVAGYYALTYLGEDLDREAVEARLDELLALELAPALHGKDRDA